MLNRCLFKLIKWLNESIKGRIADWSRITYTYIFSPVSRIYKYKVTQY